MSLLGVALVGLAVILFVIDIKIAAHGLITALGLACLIAGTVLWGKSGGPDPLLTTVVVALIGGFSLLVSRKSVAALRQPQQTGDGALIGAIGTAREHIAPSGIAFVEGARWQVRSQTPIPAGSRVQVIGRHGLVLDVRSYDSGSAAYPAAVNLKETR